ncbi:hypothetical protein K523DRAFT_159655 [Schizophyllum commune Tattone D]|nr:hypothetical protein K523DRAFT_159655 [Schizophyllum commune Tattone D]
MLDEGRANDAAMLQRFRDHLDVDLVFVCSRPLSRTSSSRHHRHPPILAIPPLLSFSRLSPSSERGRTILVWKTWPPSAYHRHRLTLAPGSIAAGILA